MFCQCWLLVKGVHARLLTAVYFWKSRVDTPPSRVREIDWVTYPSLPPSPRPRGLQVVELDFWDIDSVNFTFSINATPGRLDSIYPSRLPNYRTPSPKRDIKRKIKPGETQDILEVDKLDLTREFSQ